MGALASGTVAQMVVLACSGSPTTAHADTSGGCQKWAVIDWPMVPPLPVLLLNKAASQAISCRPKPAAEKGGFGIGSRRR